MDLEQRLRRARIANHARQAKYSREEQTRAWRRGALTALNRRLIDQYGIDIDAPDFEERLNHARSAYFGSLALRSWKKRRREAPSAEGGA